MSLGGSTYTLASQSKPYKKSTQDKATTVCTCPAIVLCRKLNKIGANCHIWLMLAINKPEGALWLLLAKSCPVVDEEGCLSITHCTCIFVWRIFTQDKLRHVIMQVLHVLSSLIYMGDPKLTSQYILAKFIYI